MKRPKLFTKYKGGQRIVHIEQAHFCKKHIYAHLYVRMYVNTKTGD